MSARARLTRHPYAVTVSALVASLVFLAHPATKRANETHGPGRETMSLNAATDLILQGAATAMTPRSILAAIP